MTKYVGHNITKNHFEKYCYAIKHPEKKFYCLNLKKHVGISNEI